MKAYLIFLLTFIMVSVSCTNQKEEYRTCVMKSANYQMIRAEKTTQDELLKLCSKFDDYLNDLDADEKGENQLFLDSVVMRINKKELFQGYENSKLSSIPCGNDFIDILDKKGDEFSEGDNDIKDVAKKFDYLFLKRDINCSIYVDNISERGDLFDKHVEIDSEGNISVYGSLYVEDKIYNNFRFLVKMPEKYLKQIKERTGYFDGEVFQQSMSFEGRFVKTSYNQLGHLIFIFKADTVEFIDI